MKHELQNIISGKSQVKHGANIQAGASYLKDGKRTGTLAEKGINVKKQEEILKKTAVLTRQPFLVGSYYFDLFNFDHILV